MATDCAVVHTASRKESKGLLSYRSNARELKALMREGGLRSLKLGATVGIGQGSR